MITQTINLNLIPGSPQPRINVSQYDNGSRTLQFNLYNGVSPYEIPSGASVYIVGTKADNTGFEYACTFDGSLVSVDITDQMTVFAGEVQSELQIRQSGEVLGTANFIINVERAALSDDTQISETDIPIIQRIPEILGEAEEYADTAHKWATFGADTETPSSTNNAKYWAEQSQTYAAGALHWKSSVTFANIPTSGMVVGDFYNITDDFTTDSRFDEGAGIKCAAGTNIVWDTNNKWDILTPSTVASQVKYDGTTSGLSATNVQGAINELNSGLNSKAITSITRSGTTFTAKNSAGTSLFTFTQQDNNTTTGDGIKTKTAQSGTSGTSVATSIAAGTTMDNAIGILLKNDYKLNSDFTDSKMLVNFIAKSGTINQNQRCVLNKSTSILTPCLVFQIDGAHMQSHTLPSEISGIRTSAVCINTSTKALYLGNNINGNLQWDSTLPAGSYLMFAPMLVSF